MAELAGELGVKDGRDRYPFAGRDCLERVADQHVIVHLGGREVADVHRARLVHRELPGFDLEHAALRDLRDKCAILCRWRRSHCGAAAKPCHDEETDNRSLLHGSSPFGIMRERPNIHFGTEIACSGASHLANTSLQQSRPNDPHRLPD